MSYCGISNWPPVWTRVNKKEVKTLKGEIGTLEYVYANARVSGKCYLVIQYDRERYIGCLIFSDHTLCDQITSLLSTQLGRTIAEIGDLDLAHTF